MSQEQDFKINALLLPKTDDFKFFSVELIEHVKNYFLNIFYKIFFNYFLFKNILK